MQLTDTLFPAPHYEIRPRKYHRGVDLISDALPFGGLWYTKPDSVRGRRCATVVARRPTLNPQWIMRPAHAAALFDCFQIGQTDAHFAVRIRNRTDA